ncbi:MAG: hypothetical protein ACP5GJ_03880 [Nanopusillaceae archaeon]|jgi:hypothetical protein
MVKTIKDAVRNYYLAITNPKTPAKYIQGIARFLNKPASEVAKSRAAMNYISFTYNSRIDAQKYIQDLEKAFEE